MTDTAEKRRNAAGVPFLPLGPNVTPNALKDAEWRDQVAWGYSGVAVSAPPAGTWTRQPGDSAAWDTEDDGAATWTRVPGSSGAWT